MKKNKKIIVQITLIIFMILVGIFLYSIIRKSFIAIEQKKIVEQNSITGITQIDASIPEETIVYKNISDVVNIDTCAINDVTGLDALGYKYIDVFSGEVSNPKNDYKKYTNQFYVQPGFKEAYLCVVANVVPSLQNEEGKYYLGILFNDQQYEGLVNVAINSKGIPYDYTSEGAEQKLTGRMYGLQLKEQDKSYRLDLNGVIVGVWNGGYKVIKPIDRLNLGNQKTLRIGGYISAGTNGIIKKFRIFYKGGFIDSL